MYKKILIATDGSELADKAVEQGLTLAQELKSSVVVLTVNEPLLPLPDYSIAGMTYPLEIGEYEKIFAERAEKILEGAQVKARKLGLSCSTLCVHAPMPADGIIETAKKEHCDLIIMASHGRRGIERLLLGSQALAVLTHSKIPVLICY